MEKLLTWTDVLDRIRDHRLLNSSAPVHAVDCYLDRIEVICDDERLAAKWLESVVGTLGQAKKTKEYYIQLQTSANVDGTLQNLPVEFGPGNPEEGMQDGREHSLRVLLDNSSRIHFTHTVPAMKRLPIPVKVVGSTGCLAKAQTMILLSGKPGTNTNDIITLLHADPKLGDNVLKILEEQFQGVSEPIIGFSRFPGRITLEHLRHGNEHDIFFLTDFLTRFAVNKGIEQIIIEIPEAIGDFVDGAWFCDPRIDCEYVPERWAATRDTFKREMAIK